MRTGLFHVFIFRIFVYYLKDKFSAFAVLWLFRMSFHSSFFFQIVLRTISSNNKTTRKHITSLLERCINIKFKYNTMFKQENSTQ